MPPIPNLAILFQRFGIALGIGLMIGVEREREKYTFGGIRTFPLIALLGCISAMVHEHFAPWSFAATFIIFSAFVLVSYLLTGSAKTPGITTEVSSLLVFLYGGLVWWRMTELAAALAVVTVLLLATKQPLEQLSLRIQSEDIVAALQFGVITLIILPILPDMTFGPLDVLNPRQIWTMVVLIAGVNLVGYALVKLLGTHQGIGLAGLLGGLVSSTATTLGFSQHSREEPHLSRDLALGIVLASTIMFVRVLVITLTINASLGRVLLAPLASAGCAGLAGCAYLWFYQKAPSQIKEEIEAHNPFELWPAIQFGFLFGVILLLSKAAQVFFGTAGVYVSSILAGLTDVDAINLSLSSLAGKSITEQVAARGITLAALANTAVKGGIAAITGAPELRRLTAPIFGFMIAIGIIVSFVIN